VPASLSAVPVTILHTVCVPASLSAVPVTILHYSVCASKAVCRSCHRTALQWVCQQVCLQFLSPSCIQCVCQQVCLQFLSTHCITACVQTMFSAVPVTILHCSVCDSKVLYSSCHHFALQRECKQCSQQFLSPYCITVCVPASLSAVPVNILHYSVCANNVLCSSCHHTALLYVCQQVCLQFLSTYCITVCVCKQCSLQFLSPYCNALCVPVRLSRVPVTILHYSVCANNVLCSSCNHTAFRSVCQQGCLQFLSPY